MCRQARAAASAAAASASSVEVAVTWVDAMDRMAWCRAAAKDSSSAVTMARDLRRRARAAACPLRSAVANTSVAFGSPQKLAGRPAEAAQAVAQMEFLAVQLPNNPFYPGISPTVLPLISGS